MFCIANNEGDLYAHDICTREKAESILADIIYKIGEKQAQDEELEIIEQ